MGIFKLATIWGMRSALLLAFRNHRIYKLLDFALQLFCRTLQALSSMAMG
jgi:hypothetical protein